jgi:Zn-dependent protease
MLNEPASTINDRRPRPSVDERPEAQPPKDDRLDAVRAAAMQVMAIETEQQPAQLKSRDVSGGMIMLMDRDARLLLRFDGRLLTDSEAAYDQLDAQFMPLNLTPVFRESDSGTHFVYVIEGRAKPQPRGWTWNAALFVLTLFSVLYVGATIWAGEFIHHNPLLGPFLRSDFNNNPLSYLHRGIPYAGAILLILGAHELGHYFAARRRGIAVTLPYFLPFPFGAFGTFGAFIQLREPMRNRKVLLEIGAAGPLAGLVFAIPILLYGLATSPTAPLGPGLVEGNSILYAAAKFLVFGEWVPNARYDVLLNQWAWAGWTGLFVTGLNLLPIGQLDGGHILYSLIGERAKYMYYPAIIGMGVLTVLTDGSLLFMLILLIFFGRVHAVPLDNITPLDPRRRLVAIVSLAVFVLVFVPVPLSEVQAVPPPPAFGDGTASLAFVVALVIVGLQRLRR